MKLFYLTLMIMFLASCSREKNRIIGLSSEKNENSVETSPDGFSENNFYVDSQQTTPSFSLLESTNKIYTISLALNVYNYSKIPLRNVQALIQIFNGQGKQIGMKFVDSEPSVVYPNDSAWFSVKFSPIHDPYYVTSYRITPLSHRGKGWVTKADIVW